MSTPSHLLRTEQIKTTLNASEVDEVRALFGGHLPDSEELRWFLLMTARQVPPSVRLMSELKFLRIFALNQLPPPKARELERYADSQKLAKARQEFGLETNEDIK